MIKNFKDFVDESFTLTSDKLPEIDDIADNVDYKEGEEIAFVDYNNVKDIPIRIINKDKKNNDE